MGESWLVQSSKKETLDIHNVLCGGVLLGYTESTFLLLRCITHNNKNENATHKSKGWWPS